MSAISRGLTRLLAMPLMMCALRPFFLLTAASAIVLILLWQAFLSGAGGIGVWLGGMPGGAIAWHAHELLFGYGLAAIIGFLLASLPEFAQAPPPSRSRVAALGAGWLAARLTMIVAPWLSFPLAVAVAALANLALVAGLLFTVVPPLRTPAGREHLGFAYALSGLGLLQAGFWWTVAAQGDVLRWLYAAVGGLMILIIVAASRISMRIVNSRIVEGRLLEPLPDTPVYLARPPRRQFVIFTLVLCSGLEFFDAPAGVIGWSALAASAAVLGLLNDWHVGRPLLNRWALMLYACYVMLALGYGLMGLSWLQAPWSPSAGRHLLMIGAMGLSIFTVLCIAGRLHSGQWLDQRRWVIAGALGLVTAALLRAAAGLPIGPASSTWLLTSAAALWVLVFTLYLWRMAPLLAGPRKDGLDGCEEPEGGHAHGASRCG